MTRSDDIEALAAEYVLGTLDMQERAMVAARRQREADLDAAISDWERRLSPLDNAVPSVAPGPEVWRRIEQQIAGAARGSAGPSDVVDLTRRLKFWRRSAIAASAIAASLILAIGVREMTPHAEVEEPRRRAAEGRAVAGLPRFRRCRQQDDDRASRWRPQHEKGKSYELWIVHDSLGAPKSLGVIDDPGMMQRPTLAAYKRDVIETATLAVSLEPEGGSPTGAPTGPVVFAGKMIEQQFESRSAELHLRSRHPRRFVALRKGATTCASGSHQRPSTNCEENPETRLTTDRISGAPQDGADKIQPETTPMIKLIRATLLGASALALAASFTATVTTPSFAEKTVSVGGAPMYPSKNIVENAVNSKDHTTLVAAVKAAGLVDTLTSPGPFTVFAPVNKAFDQLPKGTVETLLKPENKDKLTGILTYHVVAGRCRPKRSP